MSPRYNSKAAHDGELSPIKIEVIAASIITVLVFLIAESERFGNHKPASPIEGAAAQAVLPSKGMR
jgi:hypothetical protein